MSLLTEHTLTVHQRPGSYVGGVWVAGTLVPSTIQGSLQPLNGRELQLLEEGQRRRGTAKLYTEAELRTTSEAGFRADTLTTSDGRVFEVHSVERWEDMGSLSHFKYMLVEVAEDEP